jgi:hypothetical protein
VQPWVKGSILRALSRVLVWMPSGDGSSLSWVKDALPTQRSGGVGERWPEEEWIALLRRIVTDVTACLKDVGGGAGRGFNAEDAITRNVPVKVSPDRNELRNVNCGEGITLLDTEVSRGRASFTFKLVKDNVSSETTCFGAVEAGGPIPSGYQTDRVYAYRCFNGNVYNAGEELTGNVKVRCRVAVIGT